MQIYLRAFSDQQMRMCIVFSNLVDEKIMKRAARLAIIAEPIFSYQFREEKRNVVLKKHETIDEDALFYFIETPEPAKQIDIALTKKVTPESNPMVQLSLIRYAGNDTLCINMSHIPADGSGLKEFAYLLANIYNKLINDANFLPQANINGSRGINQVLKYFSFRKKLFFFWKAITFKRPTDFWHYQWIIDDNPTKQLLLHRTLSAYNFNALKIFSKQNGTTLNDAILSAFIRALNIKIAPDAATFKPILVPVDLRKFIPGGEAEAICNLSAMVVCNMKTSTGENFQDTLNIIHNDFQQRRAEYAEFFLMMPFLLFSNFLNFTAMKVFARKILKPPVPPVISNCGIIDSNLLNFQNGNIVDAKIFGLITHGDVLCVSFSTFKNQLTVSVGFKGSQNQQVQINDLLDEFENNLKNLN